MSDEQSSTERNVNLWAPWRMEYISSLADEDAGCFLCRDRDDPANDAANLVLWRGPTCFAVLNRFPYTGGHTMIAPLGHLGELDNLDSETMTEMMELVRDTVAVLRHVVGAHGFNVGMNIGRCAGAGLPGHLHMHVVPRWRGDTNFLPVFGKVRVIPETLQKLREQIIRAGLELGLPKPRS